MNPFLRNGTKSPLTQTGCCAHHGVEARRDAVRPRRAPASENIPVMVVDGQLLHAHTKKSAGYSPHCHTGDEQTRWHLEKEQRRRQKK